jgi:hypothetical protein
MHANQKTVILVRAERFIGLSARPMARCSGAVRRLLHPAEPDAGGHGLPSRLCPAIL